MEVTILYNAPVQAKRGRPEDRISMEGILDQVEAVDGALRELGIDHESIPVENADHLLGLLGSLRNRAVFNLVEELQDRIDNFAIVPFLCELKGIPCTGAGHHGVFLCQDKFVTNVMLAAHGVPVPRSVMIRPGREPGSDLPPYPLIVKPLHEDAGLGIWDDSVVGDPAGLGRAVERIWTEYRQPALVEAFIGQREVNVSAIEGPEGLRILPPAEIDFSHFPEEKPRIVGYAAKWVDTTFEFRHTERIIPAPLPENVRTRIEGIVRLCWDVLACRDYARVDMRLDHALGPFVIEVNPNPDISLHGGFAAALDATGIPYREFVHRVLQNAVARTEA